MKRHAANRDVFATHTIDTFYINLDKSHLWYIQKYYKIMKNNNTEAFVWPDSMEIYQKYKEIIFMLKNKVKKM